MSTEGILMPEPVPSSDITMLEMSSFVLSAMIARATPAYSISLTFLKKEQSPLSATINGGK